MVHSKVHVNARTYFCSSLLAWPERHSPGLLSVADGVVVSIGPADRPPRDAERLDGTVVPGLIDLQVNGLGDNDVLEGTVDAIAAIGWALVTHGVTSWLPTVVSAGEDSRLRALDAIAEARERDGGAHILGAHLEGPWISPARAGAHDRSALVNPTPEELNRSLGRHAGLVRIVTLAPELPGGLDAVRQVTDAGAIASLGHTDATYGQATAAIDAGARMATHLYNAMRPFHQREPGVIGTVLADQRVTAGLIADGVHVHPANVAIAFLAKPGRIALVSDAVSGEGDGARTLPDGTLAGSLSSLSVGLRQAATGTPLPDVVHAATAIPASALGEPYGALGPGAPGDFIVLDDDLRPKATYISGELVWSAR